MLVFSYGDILKGLTNNNRLIDRDYSLRVKCIVRGKCMNNKCGK